MMKLKSLRMRGFKSFPEATSIAFEKGITAIVGPNGSGKSNVADAIRWVLGEQSAKQLRGAKMDEVIFGGTDSRRASGSCEVILTLEGGFQLAREKRPDRAEAAGLPPNPLPSLARAGAQEERPEKRPDRAEAAGLPPNPLPSLARAGAQEETTITRRLYRSGESEYLINNTPVRLRDIHDLLRDTGAGREGYSVIGQGRIDEILSNRAEDRRAVFEEAAGIGGFRARRDEAQRKLNASSTHLQRVEDILETMGDQLEPLRGQVAVTRQFLELSSELKTLELAAFVARQDDRANKLDKLEEQVKQLNRECDDAQDISEQLQYKSEQAEAAFAAAEQAAVQARQDQADAALAETQAQGDITLWKERLAAAETELARLQAAVADGSGHGEEIKQNIEKTRQLLTTAQADSEKAATESQKIRQEHEAMAEKLAAEEAEIEQTREAMLNAINAMGDLRARAGHLDALQSSVEKQSAQMAEAEQQAAEKQTEAQKEAAEAVTATQTLAAAAREAAVKTAAAAQGVTDAQAAWAAAGQRRQAEADTYQAAQSRLKILTDLKRDHEGMSAPVRNLLRENFNNITGVVAELLSVPTGLEIAIEAALGASMQHVVCPNEDDARQMIEHLRRNNLGRVTFLPLSAIRARSLTPAEARHLNKNDKLPALASDLVSCEYDIMVKHLLGRTVIAEDLQSGIKLARASGQAFRIVTLQGDMLNAGGAITGGSHNARVGGLFQRERERQELKKRIVIWEEKLRECDAKVAGAQSYWDDARAQHAALIEEQARVEAVVAAAAEREAILAETAQERKAAFDNLATEKDKLAQTTDDIEQQRLQVNRLIQQAQEGRAGDSEQLEKTREAYAEARRIQTEKQALVTAAQMAAVEADTAVIAHERELLRLKHELDRLSKGKTVLEAELQRAQKQRAETEQGLKAAQDKAQNGEQLQIDLAQAAITAEKRRQEAYDQTRAVERARREHGESIAEMVQKLTRAESAATALATEREAAAARIFETYQLTYAEAASIVCEHENIKVSESKISQLKEQIRELGPVNPGAVEEYAELDAKTKALEAQKEDLLKAMDDLHALIQTLNNRMAKRFAEAFHEINEEFGRTFRKLFGGGQAELAINGDFLTGGIEITAQPPGTKMRSLLLLSGGQRALTAIALLFAML
ncbi:MAG: chromosome segregation protein SMC, partial [Clostridia bacterium]|nr:chromosome segregation protein SMC [Clostridia bacterium]